jgi:hypothetical protein
MDFKDQVREALEGYGVLNLAEMGPGQERDLEMALEAIEDICEGRRGEMQ